MSSNQLYKFQNVRFVVLIRCVKFRRRVGDFLLQFLNLTFVLLTALYTNHFGRLFDFMLVHLAHTLKRLLQVLLVAVFQRDQLGLHFSHFFGVFILYYLNAPLKLFVHRRDTVLGVFGVASHGPLPPTLGLGAMNRDTFPNATQGSVDVSQLVGLQSLTIVRAFGFTLERLENTRPTKEVMARRDHWFQRYLTAQCTRENILNGAIFGLKNGREKFGRRFLLSASGQRRHDERQVTLTDKLMDDRAPRSRFGRGKLRNASSRSDRLLAKTSSQP
jgi:hypothetical protein